MESLKPFSRIDGQRLRLMANEGLLAAAFFGLVLTQSVLGRNAPTPTEEFTVGNFFFAFAAATILILVAIKAFGAAKFVGAIFDLAIFLGVSVLVQAFMGPMAGLLWGAGAIFLRYLLPRVVVFDAVIIAGMAGVVASIGPGFRPLGLVVILALLAVYDIIAVYVTGHMVTLARELLRQKAFFAIIVPAQAKGWLTPLSQVERGGDYSFLGTGDLVLPALLIYAAARADSYSGIMVAIGALLGLAATNILFMSQRQPKPMPALPPIALGSITGYLLSLLVF